MALFFNFDMLVWLYVCEFLTQLLTSVGHGNSMICPLSSVLCWLLVGCSWKKKQIIVFMFGSEQTITLYVCIWEKQRLLRLCWASPGLTTSAPSVYQFAVTLVTQRETSLSVQRKTTTCMLDTEGTSWVPLYLLLSQTDLEYHHHRR